MEKLQGLLNAVEEKLADSSLYEDARKDDLKQRLAEQADTKAKLEDIEMVWMELTEQLESSD